METVIDLCVVVLNSIELFDLCVIDLCVVVTVVILNSIDKFYWHVYAIGHPLFNTGTCLLY